MIIGKIVNCNDRFVLKDIENYVFRVRGKWEGLCMRKELL
jgi:hypothetical protein